MPNRSVPHQRPRAAITRRGALQAGVLAVGATVVGTAVAAEPKARIKVGQIGVGHAHASKLSAYRASPDYEVVGVVEPDEGLRVNASRDAWRSPVEKCGAGKAAYPPGRSWRVVV